MSKPAHEALIAACALILTPNEEFKEWLKTAALSEKVFPASVDKIVDKQVLYNHSVAFITPQFQGKEEFAAFMNEHYEYILNSLFLAWPFSLEAYQQRATRQSLAELFDRAYYLYLVNMLDPALQNKTEITCSVTMIKPKLPCFEWIHQAGINAVDKLDLDSLRKFGVALLTPAFKSSEEEKQFMQEHHQVIWRIALSCYSDNQALWPQDLSYEQLQQWFDCDTCYPVVDLTKQDLIKKAA